MRDLWQRLYTWWHTCPKCRAYTPNLEAHWQIDHADDWEDHR